MTVTARRALVVLSGGQDSTTCLYWAIQKWGGPSNVAAVTFDYNQRHRAEIAAARQVCSMAGVVWHRVVEVGNILDGRSPLTNPGQVLEQYKDFASMDAIIGDRVELTFVPMRNALFLTLAANLASVYGVDNIVTGVCQEDNANYPDCRKVFVHSMEQMINTALGYDTAAERSNVTHAATTPSRYVQIHAPLIHRTKAQSVRLALATPGAFEALAWSHTSYDGKYPPLGKDHATILRAHGFEEAGLPDPLVLRAVAEGLMEMPDTANYSPAAIDIAKHAAVPYNQ
jgi:7-cyano-7-deazaguanine synthase